MCLNIYFLTDSNKGNLYVQNLTIELRLYQPCYGIPGPTDCWNPARCSWYGSAERAIRTKQAREY